MKIWLSIPLIFYLFSCKKSNTQPTIPADILMGHTWYPYQIRIVTIDSNTVVTYDSVGNYQTKNTVLKSDTIFLTAQCLQQSSYNFQQNGSLIITNMCNPSQSIINTNWTITQTNILVMEQIGNLGSLILYSYSGLVNKIDNSQFDFNTVRSQFAFGNSFGPNSTKVSTSDKTISNEYTTYKSR